MPGGEWRAFKFAGLVLMRQPAVPGQALKKKSLPEMKADSGVIYGAMAVDNIQVVSIPGFESFINS